ncbi:hypothetical protein D1007_21947 [Hordeum vulgare]|nr:hypothetical protein D1007_21944 [Hordeum vulgare]KAE8802395.1 hypothetical protein D1007_21947 [Hordeum vulgare]
MMERFSRDGAAANVLGCRWLHEWEARLLQEANNPTPPDMRVPGAWQLSVGRVLVPPPPCNAERHAKIARIQESLPKDAHQHQRYYLDNHAMWMAFFQRHHVDQLVSTNGAPAPRGCHKFDGRRPWWASPGACSTTSSSTSMERELVATEAHGAVVIVVLRLPLHRCGDAARRRQAQAPGDAALLT